MVLLLIVVFMCGRYTLNQAKLLYLKQLPLGAMAISKNSDVKYDPLWETPTSVELNALSARQLYRSTTAIDDCF